MVAIASTRVLFPEGLAPGLLHVEGPRLGACERTSAAGHAGAVARARAGGEVLDAGDDLVTPAFVNAHTHLSLVSLRGVDPRKTVGLRGDGNLVEELFFRTETHVEAADVRAFVRMGAYESLLAGVGLVWDHYYFADEVAAALRETGLAGVVAPTLQDRGGPFPKAWEAGLEAAARLAGDAAAADAGVFAALGPHATDTVSAGLWRRALEASERHGLPIHAHCAQSIEELARAHAEGATPLGLLERAGVLEGARSLVLAHGIFEGEAGLAKLDPARHALVFCPASSHLFAFPSRTEAWTRRGLRWALATDCAANNDSMNVQKELRAAAAGRTYAGTWSPRFEAFRAGEALDDARAAWRARAAAFDEGAADAAPERLLARVWSIPGAFHPAFRAGVLAPGALANVVVWGADHPSLWPLRDAHAALAMGDTTQAIRAMLVAGRWVGEPGRFHASLVECDGYRAAREEADGRLASLLRRAGVASG